MGGGFQSVVGNHSKETDLSVIIFGLENAGKKTIIERLRSPPSEVEVPYRNLSFTVLDINSKMNQKIQTLWGHYYIRCNGLIFVLDSSDKSGISRAREVLDNALQESTSSDIPLLVLANKQDVPNGMSSIEIADALGLPKLKDRCWFLQTMCAIDGEGLYDGLGWLCRALDDDEDEEEDE